MKQNEVEWVEYQKVMKHVVRRSGLNMTVFYDLRGNHDNFGVPAIGGPFDFFSKYSLSAQLGRTGLVNGVTLQTSERKLLFVGFDSAMPIGLRGSTNLFGHPTEQLLNEINSELSQWDSESAMPMTKISFGHFPLSFSVSGATLADIFLRNSLSVYLCGHLHTKFGKNLKRHHVSTHHLLFSDKYLQLHPRTMPSGSTKNCSKGISPVEFWEWEMGDWRRNRAMRILAIDRGFLSFIDSDFRSGRKNKTTIILPTFPVDSRFMPTSLYYQYNCESLDQSSYGTIRALVFSTSPIFSVVARIYDSRLENSVLVLEADMRNHGNDSSRGDLYIVPWNYKAFEDPSSDRYWLQIEAIDNMGRSILSELRPFSINGICVKFSWSWREFLLIGCQWDALYYPIIWSSFSVIILLLIVPKALLALSKQHYTYRNFISNKGFINGMAWLLTEFYKIPLLWIFILAYLFYLILCPWLSGQVFTDGGERGYMTYRGWVMKSEHMGKLEFLGIPDAMVIVFPHIFYVVCPAILVTALLAAEGGTYRDYLISLSGKKKVDDDMDGKKSGSTIHVKSNAPWIHLGKRWIRSILLVVSFAICHEHYRHCRALVKAYEMNPFIHFPLYCFSIPLLLAYAFYKTWRI